jgi:hypothetical protein
MSAVPPTFYALADKMGLRVTSGPGKHLYDCGGINISKLGKFNNAADEALAMWHEMGHYIAARYSSIARDVYLEHAIRNASTDAPDPESVMGLRMHDNFVEDSMSAERSICSSLLRKCDRDENWLLSMNNHIFSLQVQDAVAITSTERRLIKSLGLGSRELAATDDIFAVLKQRLYASMRTELVDNRPQAIKYYRKFWHEVTGYAELWARVPGRHLMIDYGLSSVDIETDGVESTYYDALIVTQDVDLIIFAEEAEDERANALVGLLETVGSGRPWRDVVRCVAGIVNPSWPQCVSMFEPELEVLKRIGLVTETAEGCLEMGTD